MFTEKSFEVSVLTEDYGYDESALLWVEDPDGGHDEESWAKRLPFALSWLPCFLADSRILISSLTASLWLSSRY